MNGINRKSILVTGGTGSFGMHFIKKILKIYDVERIIVFSRDELKQFEMQQMEPFSSHWKKMRYFLGDIRDYKRLTMAMNNVDIVIQAAALKHVPAAEYNPFEAVKTNVIGGQNVIDAAINCGVKKVIALSTDKAAAPINIYGATKLTSDKLFIAANNYRGMNDIKLSVVRYGNVMGSRGSVIPFFIKEKEKGVLPITDKRMTRFSITLDQGVEFVLHCLNVMWGGELFVPKIPSFKILDLAQAIAPDTKQKIIGIRPGEKLHEEMITRNDAINTIDFEDYFVVLPSTPLWDKKKFMKESSKSIGIMCESDFSYNSKSNHDFLSIEQIKKLLKEHLSYQT